MASSVNSPALLAAACVIGKDCAAVNKAFYIVSPTTSSQLVVGGQDAEAGSHHREDQSALGGWLVDEPSGRSFWVNKESLAQTQQ